MKKILALGLALFASAPALVSAQSVVVNGPPLVGNNLNATIGGPAPVTVTFTQGGSPQQALQYSVLFDQTRLSLPLGPLPASAFNPPPSASFGSCNHPSPGGTIICTYIDILGSANLPSPITLTIPFTALSTPGVTPITLQNIVGTPSPISGTNGTVTIAAGPQPRYSSAPAPGSTITITDPVGGGATTATLAVTNIGQAGAGNLTLDPISGLSGVLSIAPAAPVNIAQGATTNLTISCATATAGSTTQTLSITHNGEVAGGGAASPATYQVRCDGVVVNTPPTVSLGTPTQPPAGPINLTAAGSVPLNVDTAGAATASVTVTCTFPTPGPANFQVVSGGTRTIDAPATTGPNAPPIGVQCTRQAAAATATLSCARTTVPSSSLTPLTVDFTCPAGTTAPNPGVVPASGSTIPFSGPPGSTVNSGVTFTNTGGTQAYNVTSCTLGGASPTNFAVVGTFPLTVAAGGSASVGLTCTTPTSPGAPVTATLTCVTNAGDPPFQANFNLTCQSLVLAVPAMGWAGKALMILLVLGFGLVGFQLYRRTA